MNRHKITAALQSDRQFFQIITKDSLSKCLQLPILSVPITDVVSSNPAQGEVYNIM